MRSHHNPSTIAAAAETLARGLGAEAGGGTVEISRRHALVTLRRSALVARVVLPEEPHRGLAVAQRELDVARHLAAAGAPTATPAARIAAGPHVRDGLIITFWEHIDGGSRTDYSPRAAGRALRTVHDALGSYPGALPSVLDHVDDGIDAVARLERLPEHDVELLIRCRDDAVERLEASDQRQQPVHGDAHLGNVVWSRRGPVWLDFEGAALGAREWDVACLAVETAVYERGPDVTAAVLAGYGAFDARLLPDLLTLRVVQFAAVSALKTGPGVEVWLGWLRSHAHVPRRRSLARTF